MNKKTLTGLIVAAITVLGTVYIYNRFSGRNIADFGKRV